MSDTRFLLRSSAFLDWMTGIAVIRRQYVLAWLCLTGAMLFSPRFLSKTAAQELKLRAVLSGHVGDAPGVYSVGFSPDGKILQSAGGDKTVRLWNVATGSLIATLKHKNPVRSSAFSPDGRMIASTDGRTVLLWEVASRQIRATLVGHSDDLETLAFASDGKTLATGGTIDP